MLFKFAFFVFGVTLMQINKTELTFWVTTIILGISQFP